jgi:tetratricopeptide (TPR) repeat protein
VSWIALGSLLVKQAERSVQGASAREGLGEAADVLSRALVLDAQNFQAHYWLGRAYLLLGNYAHAIRELEAAQRLAVAHVLPREYLMTQHLVRLARARNAGQTRR